MSMIPIDGYNTYYSLDGYNTLMLDVINPFGYFYNFAVTIEAPTFPSLDPDIEEEPNFELSDFLLWCLPMREYLEDGESSTFYPLYQALLVLAKTRVRWLLIYEEVIWKRLVSLYIAHYLEININAMKDEANRMSLNGYEKDKDYKYEFEVGGEVFKDLQTTLWGRQFYFEFKPYAKFEHWGINY